MEAIVVDRAFVRVAGPEAEAYLQGQLSQDLNARPMGLSFLLEPTGKVCALVRYIRQGTDAFLLDTDAAGGEALLARLRRFLLRTKADVEATEHRCTRVFGADVRGAFAAPWPPAADAPVDVIDDDVAGAAELDRVAYERRRILAGVPVSGIDIGPDTIPAEVGAWAVDAAVSFTKGCYTGQELVARIDSRGGNVPRPLRVLRSADGADLPAASDITDAFDITDAEGAGVGRATSVAADVALAALPRRVQPGAELRIGGHRAVVLR